MKIGIVMLTFNRLEYTKIVLNSYFKKTEVPHQLHIWDNYSTDGTREWLTKTAMKKYPITITLNSRNIGIPDAIRGYFRLSRDKDLVGKIDNDLLIKSDHWLENFAEAFKRVPELAVAGAYNKLKAPGSFRNFHGVSLNPTKHGMDTLWLVRRSIVDKFPFVERGYGANWNWFSRLGKQVLVAYVKNVYYLTDNRQWGGTSPFPDINYDAYNAKVRQYRRGKLPK